MLIGVEEGGAGRRGRGRHRPSRDSREVTSRGEGVVRFLFGRGRKKNQKKKMTMQVLGARGI